MLDLLADRCYLVKGGDGASPSCYHRENEIDFCCFLKKPVIGINHGRRICAFGYLMSSLRAISWLCGGCGFIVFLVKLVVAAPAGLDYCWT